MAADGKSSSLDVVTYASVGVMAVLGVSGLPNPGLQAAALGLCAAFAGVHLWVFQAGRHVERPALYFATQAGLITLMLSLGSGTSDAFTFLFYIVTVQTTLALSSRAAAAWTTAYFVIAAAHTLLTRGDDGVYAVFFYVAAFLLCGLLGRTFRQIEQAHRRNEQLLVTLQAAQQKVQELAVVEERNRLARDLHDSAKQLAFALSAQLDAARSGLRQDPAAADRHIERAELLADRLRAELASLILELRPLEMSQVGFIKGLHHFAESWAEQSRIVVQISVEGGRPLPDEVERALFRIVQEALANVARHSRARQAQVRLTYAADTVTLVVQDDGKGFDPVHSQAGMGTQSMRERVAALPGGSLLLDTEPGLGTRVTVACAC